MARKKYLVKVWEKRAISFEVEAEDEKDAVETANDFFANDDDMQDEMLGDNCIEGYGAEVIKELGEANPQTDEKNETVKLVIERKKLDYWEKLLKKDDLDYDELGFAEYSTVMKWTVKFSDGCEIDIKVNSDRRDNHDLFSEAVLFDKDGNQLEFTDVQYDLRGIWNLEHGGKTYRVDVCSPDEH